LTRRAWLTPDDIPSTVRRCVVEFPDGEDWAAMLRGALYTLSEESNFEAFGVITPQETADRWRQTLFLFNLDECMVIPVGAILAFAAGSTPDGFLLCDGSEVSRTTYAELYNEIGTFYGFGDNSTTFNLPDLRHRVPVGRDGGDVDFFPLGKTGGEKNHTLSTAELPVHSSPIPVEIRDPGTAIPGNGNFFIPKIGGSAGTARTHNTGNVGSGTAHNNVPPYLVLNYIIRFRS